MKIEEVITILQEIAPLEYAENFDNVGLIIGNKDTELTGILIVHDALETVIDEAVSLGFNLVVCFHPIWFEPIKKLNGSNYVEKSIIKAIQNNISIYSLHTALDNHKYGVNKILCDQLLINEPKILIPKSQFIKKLTVFTIPENENKLKNALFAAGAGSIGNYDHCSFTSQGIGTYRGNDDSNPVIGKKNELMRVNEVKIEVTFEKQLEKNILKAIKENHIYEEVAYDVITIENKHQQIGLGMIGKLENPIDAEEYLVFVKDKLECGVIKHSKILNKKIQKIAVLGGSGSFAISNAREQNADLYITSDLKYHDYYKSENQMIIADIGHYESERYIKNYIFDFLKEKFCKFAPNLEFNKIEISKINTNPVKYL
ncbi:MAG: Nif3-like dinuclear metal center hexameric protein [Flavobacterium sp.]